ncbi:MAG: serine hydrolase domain-containing protein [Acidobacteriota bacterium]
MMVKKSSGCQLFLIGVLLIGLFTLKVEAQQSANLQSEIDQLMVSKFKADEPGATVIVVKDGKVLFRKGYGLANIELNIPAQPDMIFRIGSITKQFTAVAILMLEEQGKLSLTDDLTKYFPDYPTQGKKITVEHLLNHTSGIKSYTALPEWLPQWRKDFKDEELIALFKDKPMDFAPGASWNYNNSAFFLLGVIIEKASGLSYADFIEQKIFQPLGMKNSFYDRTDRIIRGRVSGYSRGSKGFVNAAYLSMTQPGAAGALMSTVDDLAIWDAALYTDKLLKPDTLKKAWMPSKLTDGRLTHYGYGWAINDYEGHQMISHGGGINGFVTHVRRLPIDKVFVSVLTNRDTGNPNPEELTLKIAAMVIGKPVKDYTPITLAENVLDQYVGVYQVSEKEKATIAREGNKLTLMFGPQKIQISPVSEKLFVFNRNRFSFIKEGNQVKALILHSDYGIDQEAKKIQ